MSEKHPAIQSHARHRRGSGVFPVLLVALSLFGTACSSLSDSPSNRRGQRGIASWYGPQFDGRPTASGEIFDMDRVSAAHRTLPFGTLVRVHNLDNGRRLDVRINDRGPFIDGRIIDLSRAAAKKIGMFEAGIARVELEILEPPPNTAHRGNLADQLAREYWVQLGAFRKRAHAEQLASAVANALAKAGTKQNVAKIYSDGTWHRVQVRGLFSRSEADKLHRHLERSGHAAMVMEARP